MLTPGDFSIVRSSVMTTTGQSSPNERTVKTRNMVDAALAVTTGLMQLPSPVETRSALGQGQSEVVSTFRHELARQVASSLLMVDDFVYAIYEERLDGNDDLTRPFRIWVVARYRSSTLYATIDNLNDALMDAISDIAGKRLPALIQSFIVDERDSYLLRGREFWSGNEPVLLASRQVEPSPNHDHM